MSSNWSEKTIEGDIFHAFVKAGAISKANANDPKKSSLVRCARTDKGVHAAGNVISLKLIIEDPDVVEKINAYLPAQIRIWGIERTIGSFSCYQACDSRWYEYLIPTHCLLPPHPSSFVAKQLEKAADEADDRDGYEERQAEVLGFWQTVEETEIRPILEELDEETRSQVMEALYKSEDYFSLDAEDEHLRDAASAIQAEDKSDNKGANAAIGYTANSRGKEGLARAGHGRNMPDSMSDSGSTELPNSKSNPDSTTYVPEESTQARLDRTGHAKLPPNPILVAAIKRLRIAYITAKRRYRVPATRIARLQTALGTYEGTHNFYNYTVNKSGRDPSAKRHIKSFTVNPKPILKKVRGCPTEEAIGEKEADDDGEETEWLSLKVHGQSFMMHQIRKMVGMAVLAVRCGADSVPLIRQSYDWNIKFSIPKAPGLGLLLERPIFDSYNKKVGEKFQDRASIGFAPYEKEMDGFKERDIYGRVFGQEQREGVFHGFFGHVDNYREPYFLFVTSKGVEATKGAKYGSTENGRKEKTANAVQSDDEETEPEGAQGEGREG